MDNWLLTPYWGGVKNPHTFGLYAMLRRKALMAKTWEITVKHEEFDRSELEKLEKVCVLEHKQSVTIVTFPDLKDEWSLDAASKCPDIPTKYPHATRQKIWGKWLGERFKDTKGVTKDILIEFYFYWGAEIINGRGKGKMKWEAQDTFDVTGRMRTFVSRR
jgi:hypothetical protein